MIEASSCLARLVCSNKVPVLLQWPVEATETPMIGTTKTIMQTGAEVCSVTYNSSLSLAISCFSTTNKFWKFPMQVTSHEEARGAAERCGSHTQRQAADFVH